MIFDIALKDFLEFLAVVFAVLYLVLAVKQNIKCWIAWIISSCLYLLVMYEASLYMEACLQVFYVVMGFYGWIQWSKSQTKEKLIVKTWNLYNHSAAIFLIFLLAFGSGLLLKQYTSAALPFLDALTSWGAIVTTYMVAKKLLENWIYWFVIDSISVYLFLSRELYLTTFLFFIYLFIIVFGYRSWNEIRKTQHA
tara:strand:+ start:790 stop:1374 length:585 start_codon:yes stop_codon:yes gene_type:complete